jgi:hypothetical protein
MDFGVGLVSCSGAMFSNNPRSRTQLTEEEARSLAHAATLLGRRWRTFLSDAHERADYRGLGLSQYTIGNLQTIFAKIGPAGLKKLVVPPSRD